MARICGKMTALLNRKDLKLTTLAIIGEGIAGRSLLFHLAKSGIPFQKIYVFSSESFARSCSLNSTAIVAARGVSTGLSSLGDSLAESFILFEKHVVDDAPLGVTSITQYSGASSKIDQFKKRFPESREAVAFGPVKARRSYCQAEEAAYMIDPETYLDWLLKSSESLPMDKIQDFVTEIHAGAKVRLKTQSGREYFCDKLILAGGVYNQYWKSHLASEKESLSKTVPGSYLEFNNVELKMPSLSLTIDGDNFIYDSTKKRLLMGSTTSDCSHEFPPQLEIQEIHRRLCSSLEVKLPDFSQALVKTGLREKAPKREPYLIQNENIFGIGGLYKNGFSLNLKLSKELIERL